MKLTDEQKKQLQDALMNTFLDKSQLKQILALPPYQLSKTDAIKKENLEKRLANLTEDYNLATEQIDTTNNAVERNRLQKQADDLFKQMEKIESEINQINEANNLRDIYNLIATKESEGRLEELIEDAYNQDPRNQELQKFIEKYIPIPSLFQILAPVKKDCMGGMQQAYLNCCSESFRKSYTEDKEAMPDSVIKILHELNNLNERQTRKIKGNSSSGIIQFIAQLLVLEKVNLPPETVNDLRDWGQQEEPKFRNLLSLLKNEGRESRITKTTPLSTYLLIQLKESKQYRKQKQYLVSAWFISEECDRVNDSELNNYDKYKLLEASNEQQNFTLKKIPQLIDNCIQEINAKGYKLSKSSFMVMLFLPLEILLKEPIDCLTIQESEIVSIGSEYQIVFRHNGRLNNFIDDWENKWEKIIDKKVKHSSKNTFCEHCHDEELITKIQKNSELVCIKLLKPPSKEIMNLIERQSVPIVVWLRETVETSNYQQEINNLKRGTIADLPNRVKQKRSDAILDKTKQHIGHHLTLLWENPRLFPPSIEYKSS